MRAVCVRQPGGPEVLEIVERPDPIPGPDEILVAVRAAGVNRADLLQRQGHYPAPPGWPEDVPGLEYAGVVEAAGDQVRGWSPGDRVMGLVGGGAYAERVVTHEREAWPLPESLSFAQGAAVTEAAITAHDALFTHGGLVAGEWVVIHAVGGGVGTMALQLARAAGARTIGTSRTSHKLERARRLGLDVALEVRHGNFAQSVVEAAGGEGADLVVELVGGSYLAEDLKAVRIRGRIVLVGLLAGREQQLDLGTLMRRRITLVGTVLRARPLEEKIAASRAAARMVVPLLETGDLLPEIDAVLPMAEAAEAHRRVASNDTFGRVVLSWD